MSIERLAQIFRLACAYMVGVLVLSMSWPATANALEFTYANMAYAYIKLTPDFSYDDNRDALIQLFHPLWWQKYHKDEFDLKDREDQTIAETKAIVDKWNKNSLITVRITANFSNYDFAKRAFVFHPVMLGMYFSVSNCCTTLPKQFQMEINNPQFISALPMAEDVAKKFLENRGDDRSVMVIMTVRLLSVSDNPENSSAMFEAEMVNAQVYDPRSRNSLIYTTR